MKRSNDFFVIFGDLAFLLFVSVVAGYVFVSVKPKETEKKSSTENVVSAKVLGVALPRLVSKTQGRSAAGEVAEIGIDKAGAISVNGQTTRKAELKARVQASHAKACTVLADRLAPAESLLQVVTVLQECQVRDVNFVYETEKER